MGKRKFTAEYKARLVIEMLQEELHFSKIAAQEGISRTQLQNWKKEFLEKAATVFEGGKTAKGAARREESQAAEKEAMLKTIGQLTLERDYLMEEATKKTTRCIFWREKQTDHQTAL